MYSPGQVGDAKVQEELTQISNALQVLADGKMYPGTTNQTKAQYWDDLVASFNAGIVAGANVPTWSVMINGIYAYLFSATAMNEIWLSPIHIDHRYKPGTKIYPHIHWTTGGTNTGVVRWGVEYSVAKGHNQQAFPATTTIYLEQAASGTAYKHMIVEASDGQAFLANVEPDSLVLMRVFRDGGHANDTCTDQAFGLMCDVHYQVDHWATKNKAPNFYK